MSVTLHQSKRELMENQLIDYHYIEWRECVTLDHLVDVAIYVTNLSDEELLQLYAMHFGDRNS
jgi:hypothetical protein